MINWRFWEIPSNHIEVNDPRFNPLQELIITLREQIKLLREELVKYRDANELLRRENLTLRDKLSNVPRPVVTTPKHFITVNSLTAELEKRDREKLENVKKDINN